jgi:predicted metal-dependent peptidase
MEKVKVARLALGSKAPYFAPGLWALRLVSTEAVPTMAVDEGWRLYVNPSFADKLSERELVGVLWHELEHLLRAHHARAREMGVDRRTHRLWNLATDAAINDGAQELGFTLPEGVIYPERLGLEPGGLEEAYYRALLEQAEEDPFQGEVGAEDEGDGASPPPDAAEPGRPSAAAWDHGSGADGLERPWELPRDHAEHPAVGEVQAAQLREEVARRVLEHHRSRGTLPAGMVRWAEGIVNPVVPWQRILQSRVREGLRRVQGRTRATYERPHRRQAAFGRVLMPGSYDVRPRVAVVIDTSGSVSDRMLAQALAEVDALLSRVGAEVWALAVDAAAAQAQKVRRARDIKLVGGGGTDMRVGIEAALELRPKVDLVVVLTDGFTPWPAEPPRVPVVAGIFGDAGTLTGAYAVPEFIKAVTIPPGA